MKYFNNVTSLENLKAQYYKLALENHPDKGGKTEVMQEINNEYHQLFPIWKNISKDTSKETATSTQRDFYTQNGWRGENYNINLRMTDITQIIREFVKEKYPTYKFSITTRDYISINIHLMEAPEDVFIRENLSENQQKEYDEKKLDIQVNHFYIEKEDRLTDVCKEVLIDVVNFAQTYNYDDSDSMIDYFDKNFYLNLAVGKWDKPFKVVPKQARLKNKAQTNTDTNNIAIADANIQIIEYSEKAIAVIGETYAIKEELKKQGGKFNRNLSCGAGWIFPKSKKEALEELTKTSN